MLAQNDARHIPFGRRFRFQGQKSSLNAVIQRVHNGRFAASGGGCGFGRKSVKSASNCG